MQEMTIEELIGEIRNGVWVTLMARRAGWLAIRFEGNEAAERDFGRLVV